MTYERIEVAPLSAALGAEVSGIDLSEPLDDVALKEIQDAWMEHQVLFFRDQKITRDQHKDFGRRFGDLHVHPVLQPLAKDGHPEIVVLESDAKRRFVAAGWHSDVTFQNEPPLGSVLRCLDAPDVGGDTMWSSMTAAYDALSDTMQGLLCELRAVHTAGFFHMMKNDEKQQKDLEADDEAIHPVIRTHPVTGRKAIFVNSAFTRRIKGMRPRESEALLAFLYEHVGTPEFTCRFRWREGSIAMWDNRCTQHRVIADNLDSHRHMERVTILGDRPR